MAEAIAAEDVFEVRGAGIMPTVGTSGSVGFDIHCPHDYQVLDFGGPPLCINTSVYVKHVPQGCYLKIHPRSGLAKKHGVQVLGGVIDPDYVGKEIGVILAKCSFGSLMLSRGDKIAQIVCERAVMPAAPADAVERTGGFGSTDGW